MIRRRTIKRTPDIAIKVRMQAPGGAAKPRPARLGWWNQETQAWDKTTETILQIYDNARWIPDPPLVLALLDGGAHDQPVTWQGTWTRINGSPEEIEPPVNILDSLGIMWGGLCAAVYAPLNSDYPGQLRLSATQSGVTYGPITLDVPITY